MVQNARVTAFTVSELLREKQHQGREVKLRLPPFPLPRLGFNFVSSFTHT